MSLMIQDPRILKANLVTMKHWANHATASDTLLTMIIGADKDGKMAILFHPGIDPKECMVQLMELVNDYCNGRIKIEGR